MVIDHTECTGGQLFSHAAPQPLHHRLRVIDANFGKVRRNGSMLAPPMLGLLQVRCGLAEPFLTLLVCAVVRSVQVVPFGQELSFICSAHVKLRIGFTSRSKGSAQVFLNILLHMQWDM